MPIAYDTKYATSRAENNSSALPLSKEEKFKTVYYSGSVGRSFIRIILSDLSGGGGGGGQQNVRQRIHPLLPPRATHDSTFVRGTG